MKLKNNTYYLITFAKGKKIVKIISQEKIKESIFSIIEYKAENYVIISDIYFISQYPISFTENDIKRGFWEFTEINKQRISELKIMFLFEKEYKNIVLNKKPA